MKHLLIAVALTAFVAIASAQVMTPEDRANWNGFVDFLDAKGMKGSTKLDKPCQTTSLNLFNEYCASRGLKLDYHNFVTMVQTNISEYRKLALQEIRQGKALFKGTDDEFMPGLSTIDGWAGSRTTTYKFPAEKTVMTRNGQVLSDQRNAVYLNMKARQ